MIPFRASPRRQYLFSGLRRHQNGTRRPQWQKPALLWFTGLSGAGKSTIAEFIGKEALRFRKHTFVLDGDNVRHGLNRDLGFTEGDRVENIRRVAEVAKLFVEAGLITIVSFISPFRAEREMARELVEPANLSRYSSIRRLRHARSAIRKVFTRRPGAASCKNFTGLDSP